jgi:hypothetical protein
MPLRDIEGETYAAFWPEVRLPEGTATTEGPELTSWFIRSVELSTLKKLVRHHRRCG